jgi:chromosome partitioning protein
MSKKNKCMVIAISSQKGGVAKSTVTNFITYALSSPKNRVLLIDADPQASQTNSFLGLSDTNYIGDSKSNITNIFRGKEVSPLKIFDSENKISFDFIPANDELVDVTEGDEMTYSEKLAKLPEFIENIRDNYDYIIFDSPPSFGILSKSIILSADTIVVPIATRSVDENGVLRFFEKTNNLLAVNKHSVKSIYVLPTLFDKRTRTAKEMLTVIKQVPRLASQLDALAGIKCKTMEAVPYKVEVSDAPAQRMFLKEYVDAYVETRAKISEILMTLDNAVREIADTREVM